MSKKAVELSLNTVIIAALALIVLLVLFVIFTGYGGKFIRGLNDCGAKGGEEGRCEDTASDCITRGGSPSGDCIFYDDEGQKKSSSRENKVCCVYND